MIVTWDFFFFLFFFFEEGSQVAKDGLELLSVLPPLPESWGLQVGTTTVYVMIKHSII